MRVAPFKKALEKARKVIVVDPRRIGPARKADHWLQLRPGSECALALAMINVIVTEDLYDHGFVENFSFGFDRLAEHVRPYTPEWAPSHYPHRCLVHPGGHADLRLYQAGLHSMG